MAERTLKDLIFQTWDASIYLDKRFLYAIGNTRAENLLSEIDFKKRALDILLLGAGDIRHILKTVGDQLPSVNPWYNTTKPEKLHFVLNDVDDVLLARNVILLELCRDLDCNDHDDMAFLWSVWYNAELSQEMFERLTGLINRLITNTENNIANSIWSFGNEATKRAVLRVWKDWVGRKFNTKKIKENREKAKATGIAEWHKQYFIVDVLDRNVEELFKRESNVWKETGTYIPNNNGSSSARQKSIERKKGQKREPRVINPTMMRPGSIIWCLHYMSDPASSHLPFDIHDAHHAAQGLYELCFEKMKQWVSNYQQAIKDTTVEIELWIGDALHVSSYCLPDDYSFDVIHTSNLMDHLGVLNLLIVCKQRLKDNKSQLQTETMRWYFNHETVQEYLAINIGISTFCPTILGLRLMTDLKLGSCSLHGPLSHTVQLRWMLAREDVTPISIERGDCLYNTLALIANVCTQADTPFYSQRPKHDEPLRSTPLAMVLLAKDMGLKIQGGAERIITILDEVVPKSFRLQWDILKAAFGYGDETSEIVQVSMDNYYPFPRNEEKKRAFANRAAIWLYHDDAATKEELRNFPQNFENHSVISNYAFDPATYRISFPLFKRTLEKQVGIQLLMDQAPIFGDLISSTDDQQLQITQLSKDKDKDCYIGRQIPSQNHNQICIVKEYLDQYYVEISEENNGQRLSLTHRNSPSVHCAYAMDIDIKFQDKSRQQQKTISLVFANPFDDDQVTIEVSHQQGKIFCTFPKLYYGPESQLCSLDITKLPPLPEGPSESGHISGQDILRLTEKMFQCDAHVKFMDPRLTWDNVSFQFRATVQGLWNEFQLNETNVFLTLLQYGLHSPFESDGDCLGIFIRGCYWYNGMPLLHIKWIDFQEVFRAGIRRGTGIRPKDHEDFKEILKSMCGAYIMEKIIPTYQQDREMLRELLETNSKRLASKLNESKIFDARDSFIQMYFPFTQSLEMRAMSANIQATGDHEDSLPYMRGGLEFLQMIETQKAQFQQRMSQAMHSIVEHQPSSLQHQNSSQSPQTHAGSSANEAKQKAEMDRSCTFCGQAKSDMKRCGKCKLVFYCSKECQSNDWSSHKRQCKRQDTRELAEDIARVNLSRGTQGTHSVLTPKCNHCNQAKEEMKKCARCRSVWYCSKTCQKQDWAEHKHACLGI